MRASFPRVQLCVDFPATPVHPSDAVAIAEEILLRLIGSQGSQQTPSPRQSLVPSPACSGSACVGVVAETVAPPWVVLVSHRDLVLPASADGCGQWLGQPSGKGQQPECISQGWLNLVTLL